MAPYLHKGLHFMHYSPGNHSDEKAGWEYQERARL